MHRGLACVDYSNPGKAKTLTHACIDLGGNKARAGHSAKRNRHRGKTGQQEAPACKRNPASATTELPGWCSPMAASKRGSAGRKHSQTRMHRCQGSNSLCRTSNPYKSPVAVTQLDHGSAAALSFGSSTPPQIPAIAAKGKTCMLERLCAACAGRSTQYGQDATNLHQTCT
jgi:hypothetical protein